MPREIITTVYSFDELNEETQAKAVDNVQTYLARREWDSDDIESMRNEMVYTLAEKIGTPGWDKFGPADFPGIDGVSVVSFSLDGPSFIGVQACSFTRHNAPNLPWVDGIDQVDTSDVRQGTDIEISTSPRECDCYKDPHKDECDSFKPDPTAAQLEAMGNAVRDALNEALSAGQRELEYQTSEERAREDAAELEFLADGTIHR